MHVTWDPADGTEPATFTFDPEDLLSKEAVRIEKEYGQPIDQWTAKLQVKEAHARRVLLWWHLMQTHPHLQFRDVPDFRMRQLKVEMDVEELQRLSKRVQSMKLTDDQREQVAAALELDIREAMEREGGVVSGEVVELGK